MIIDWQTKRLGEVCSDFIVPQRDKPKAFDGDIPWCRIEDIEGKYLNGSLSGQKVTQELADSMNMHICPKGTVICACSASIGNQAITTVDCYTNQTFIGIVPDSSLLYNEFLYFFLKSKKEELIRMGTGSTIKYISRKKFESLKIRIPSVEEQHRIVDELDLLTGIIDKKNAQLRDLDALAQSIFFEMFGDPSLNEKGWPVKIISDLFDVGSSKRVFESEWRVSGVPFYRAREIVRLSKGEPLDDPIFIEETLFAEYKQRYGVPKTGDIMVTGVGTLGICYLVKESDRFYFKDGNTLWFKSKGLCNTRFIKDMYSTDYIKEQIKANAHGATVGTYTIVNAKNTRVIVPPIELQNDYVEKVLKIDAQKELINESLKQTQQLLDSRMDYYFNE